MKWNFFVPIYSCLQNPWLGVPPPHLRSLSSTEFVEPPPKQSSWVCHWLSVLFISMMQGQTNIKLVLCCNVWLLSLFSTLKNPFLYLFFNSCSLHQNASQQKLFHVCQTFITFTIFFKWYLFYLCSSWRPV